MAENEKLKLSIIKKKAEEAQKPREDILAGGITELNDISTLETYVSRCLDIVKAHPDVKDAEVFAATQDVKRAHISYNSAIPNKLAEPIATESAGLSIDLVLTDGRRGQVSSRSVFTVEAMKNLVELAKKDAVYDPHFADLPVPLQGETVKNTVATADKAVMELDNSAIDEIAHKVVRGALDVYQKAIEDGTLKLEAEIIELGYGAPPIRDLRTNITLHGHANVVTERWALKSTKGITVSDEATKLTASVMSGVETASPALDWGLKKESKARSSKAGTHLKDFAPEDVGATAARKVLELEASGKQEVLPSGKYKVIFSPQAVSEMMTYVGGHALNVQMALEFGETVFPMSKMGTQVMSEKLSIYDDPTIAGSISSRNVTHEGVPTRKTVLVDHGVLKDYIKDTYYANKYAEVLKADGLDAAPRNGLRLDDGISASGPRARPTYTNFVVEGHDTVPLEKMLADIKEGEKVVYIDQLWYSYPMHKERKGSEHSYGNMTSSSPAGSYVFSKKDGQIVKAPLAPNRDRLLFNVRDVLSNVEQVSTETEAIDGWASDHTIVTPYMKVGGIELVEVGKYAMDAQ